MRTMTRRAWLKRMAVGAAALAAGMGELRRALAVGELPSGVARVRGDARINGRPAQRGMEVKPGDVITTGPGAELVVVVGRDAFLVRAQSRIELSGDAARLVVASLRVVTGALLSVFEPGEPKQIRTATATIGVRGTGIYVELDGARTYVCTCYGEAELAPVDDPRAAETVRTQHHDEPRYIYPRGMPRMIEKAPVVNHTDAELIMLESLVGRTVPFAFIYTPY
jgi:hypothetical protein